MGSKDDDDDRSFGVSRKIMLAAIGSLLGVVIIIIVLHLYARYLLRRQDRRRRAVAVVSSQRNDIQMVLVDEVDSVYGQPTIVKSSSGLDPSVIASLPTFTYKLTTTSSSQVGDDHDECSVCLGTVTEGSTVRLLPNCKHVFHVECIDMWLGSQTTCPICRTSAEPRAQPPEGKELSTGRVEPTAPPVEENASSHDAAQVEKECGSSASGSGSRFGSFRRMLGRDRSSSRIQSCVDEVGTQDPERQ